jgi:hypothetical protein
VSGSDLANDSRRERAWANSQYMMLKPAVSPFMYLPDAVKSEHSLKKMIYFSRLFVALTVGLFEARRLMSG